MRGRRSPGHGAAHEPAQGAPHGHWSAGGHQRGGHAAEQRGGAISALRLQHVRRQRARLQHRQELDDAELRGDRHLRVGEVAAEPPRAGADERVHVRRRLGLRLRARVAGAGAFSANQGEGGVDEQPQAGPARLLRDIQTTVVLVLVLILLLLPLVRASPSPGEARGHGSHDQAEASSLADVLLARGVSDEVPQALQQVSGHLPAKPQVLLLQDLEDGLHEALDGHDLLDLLVRPGDEEEEAQCLVPHVVDVAALEDLHEAVQRQGVREQGGLDGRGLPVVESLQQDHGVELRGEVLGAEEAEELLPTLGVAEHELRDLLAAPQRGLVQARLLLARARLGRGLADEHGERLERVLERLEAVLIVPLLRLGRTGALGREPADHAEQGGQRPLRGEDRRGVLPRQVLQLAQRLQASLARRGGVRQDPVDEGPGLDVRVDRAGRLHDAPGQVVQERGRRFGGLW